MSRDQRHHYRITESGLSRTCGAFEFLAAVGASIIVAVILLGALDGMLAETVRPIATEQR